MRENKNRSQVAAVRACHPVVRRPEVKTRCFGNKSVVALFLVESSVIYNA